MRPIHGRLLMASLLSVGVAGHAADQPAGLEEVVVTARKQAERLQDVPDSISVVTAQTIENAGITALEDFTRLTPNVVAMQGLKPGFVTLTVRGISTIQENEAPMAVIVDGVTVPAIDFINQDMLDLQQIEVLRGPQGSLYGANAIAGAIVITTKEPSDTLEGRLKASVGNGNYRGGSMLLSGPIIDDKLFFRLGASYRDEDGTITNRFDGSKVDFYRDSTVRGQLRWRASDDVTVDLRAKYVDTNAGAIYNTVTNASVPGQINDFNDIFMDYNTPGVDRRRLHDMSLKVEWRLAGGSAGTLTSITGYGKTTDAVYGEADWLCACYSWIDLSAVPPFLYNTAQDWEVTTKAVNQELRYAAAVGDWLNYQVGAFYQKRDRNTFLLVGEDGGGHIVAPVFLSTLDDATSKQSALFGQATAKLSDKLALTLGARFDADKRSSRSELPPGPDTPTPVEHTFEQFQPKVSLAYHWTPAFMTYATFARGFRSGGFNAADTTVNGTFYPRQYDSERSTNYELGFKAESASRRVTLNGAIFRINYDDMQFFFPTLQGQILTNFPRARINGAELELAAHLTDDLSLTASYGLSDAGILAADAAGAFHGNDIPKVNKYTFNTGIEYSRDLFSPGVSFVGRVDYEHRGPLYWDVENRMRTGDKDYVNVRAGIRFNAWSLTAFARNLTNTRQPVEIIENFPPYGIGANVSRPNQERRYGVEVTLDF